MRLAALLALLPLVCPGAAPAQATAALVISQPAEATTMDPGRSIVADLAAGK